MFLFDFGVIDRGEANLVPVFADFRIPNEFLNRSSNKIFKNLV